MALESQGMSVFWSTSTSMSTVAGALIGQVTGFNGPTGSAAVIDITSLGSTAKEKMMGLADEGQLSLDVNYQSTDTAQIACRADRASRTKRRWCIKFTDPSSSIAHCEAYVTGFQINGSVDNIVKASVTFENSGPVTWTTV